MNPRILLVATALCASLPGPAQASTVTLREQSQAAVDSRGLTGLRVENPRGLVEVRPSRDGRIHVGALKIATASERDRAQRFSRLTSVVTSREGGRFVVRVRYPQHQAVRVSIWGFFRGEFDFPEVEVRLSVEVPPMLPVEIETASGSLETHDLAGSQSLQTASGDIEVHDARAPVTIATTSGNVDASGLGRAQVRSVSGDVTLEGARGPMSIGTTSGSIHLRGVGDSLALSTVSGDVWVDQAPRGIDAGTTSGDIQVDGLAAGTVNLRTASGEVELGLGRGLRRADVATVSGDITLHLAEDVACNLSLRSASGDLDSSVPLQIRTVNRHELSSIVRGGGPPVTLHSTSGDIAVTGRGR